MGMDKVVTRYLKIGTVGFVLAKVLGDELLFGPVHVAGYFAWMTLAEGGSLQVRRTAMFFYLIQHSPGTRGQLQCQEGRQQLGSVVCQSVCMRKSLLHLC
jgi:hypothetical protein